MNHLFDTIVPLNNQGCYLLGKGQRDDAMRHFKAALMTLRLSLASNPDHKNKTLLDSGISLPSLVPLHLKEFHEILSAHHYQPHRKDSRDCRLLLPMEDSSYVTFSVAIPLVPGHNFSSKASDNEKVYTAVMVFNLALTIHLKAREYRSSSHSFHPGLLKKAQSLYLHTYHLIVSIMNAYVWHGQASENVAFDLLVMGLLNNLALIHWELFEHADCHVAFQRLMQYVKISSFRASHGPGGCCRRRHNDDAATTPDGDGHSVPSIIRHDHATRRSDGPCEEDESYSRMHRMMDQVLIDMILNATYVKWNVMGGAAAAA